MQTRGWNIIKPHSRGEKRQGKISKVFSEGRDLFDFSKITLELRIGAG